MEKRKPLDITIGKNMTILRKHFNLTQSYICSILGINSSTYKHYELGDRMAPISVLQKLSSLYEISINYFFEERKDLFDEENYSLKILNITDKSLQKIEKDIQTKARLKIKNLRLENNKSQKDISNYLDIDLSTYNKYEKGSRKLNNEVVKKISQYYNVYISDIFD